MPALNYVIYDYSSSQATVVLASHCRKNIVAVVTQDRVIDDNLKKQSKNQTLYTWRRLFLPTQIFHNISS